MTDTGRDLDIAPEDAARAELYSYLAVMLAGPPGEALLDQSAALSGDPETPPGRAIALIAEAASGLDPAAAEREYTRLFIGLGRGELLPYASHYLTGNLNDKPLARLRSDMRRIGISRAEGVSDPEDHIASLFEMMAGQILGRYGRLVPVKEQRAFFATHLAPWVRRFFIDLQEAENAHLYAGIGDLGVAFLDIETRAFDLI